jgi:hypothetical protein
VSFALIRSIQQLLIIILVYLAPIDADVDTELGKRHPIGPLCELALLRSIQQLFTTILVYLAPIDADLDADLSKRHWVNTPRDFGFL